MANKFDSIRKEVSIGGDSLKYFDIFALGSERVSKLPISIRVLLECAVRNCDGFNVTEQDVEKILNWKESCQTLEEIAFKPARVLMQDFTGVPAVVDLAAMRDAMVRLSNSSEKAGDINPLVPVDLVIDHSVQVDFFGTAQSLEQNEEREYQRNKERFEFLKWGSQAFKNLNIIPPGSGIVHQVNLEHLARVAFKSEEGLIYPDTLVGTDSHTTMINGLGVLGWGVGGIEAEAAMLGMPMTMVLPKVVGFKLSGNLNAPCTATDLVLTIVEAIRKHGAVGKFVEFYGPGVSELSVADRATIANMAPEYGATCGFFPIDDKTFKYCKETGRDVEERVKALGLYCPDVSKVEYSEHLELDLSTVKPCVAGPKRPQDRIACDQLKDDFAQCMKTASGFKGFGNPPPEASAVINNETLKHGAVVIAAITSCTNTSNPSVLVAAGILARNAVAKGLKVPKYTKTSLSPGSGVVTEYLTASGLQAPLDQLGFTTAGYGCMTCIGNSGEIDNEICDAIVEKKLVACAVLSGNRNFEARVHPLTAGNYLASPPLVIAYALAGTMNINFETEPLGKDAQGKEVFLRDIWPENAEIEALVSKHITSKMFLENYEKVRKGTKRWNSLQIAKGNTYSWSDESTYIHNPPFFTTMESSVNEDDSCDRSIKNAHCLLYLGDSITTDHISPAGRIAKDSAAANFLLSRGVNRIDFNSYGSRRGNDQVMARGTFANVKLGNRLIGEGNTGPVTVHLPTSEQMSVFDASQKYQAEGCPLVILGGKEYGSGSSRDWAAKGPHLLGVNAIIAESFERIHRSNLVGMGIVPLQFKDGASAKSLGLTGKEKFTIDLAGNLKPGQDVTVKTDSGVEFTAKLRFDTAVDVVIFKHGGILKYAIRQKLK